MTPDEIKQGEIRFAEITGRTDRDLLSWVVEHAGSDSDRVRPRWFHVMTLLGLGSGAAIVLCQKFGFEPDERMGAYLNCQEGCRCECHHD